MKTEPIVDEGSGVVTGFFVGNVLIGPWSAARILRRVEGVSDVRVRELFTRFDGDHVRFRYRCRDCVVHEPFGDNSSYYIGPREPGSSMNLSEIESAFRAHQVLPLRWLTAVARGLRFR